MKKLILELREKYHHLFMPGGKLEKFYFVYEAHETLFFQPKETTKPKGAHIRDAVDMKRMMITVIAALIPCLLFGMWNAGHQHYLAMLGSPWELAEELKLDIAVVKDLINTGALYEDVRGFSGEYISWWDKFLFGAIRTIPIIAVSYIVGLSIEFVFATLNRHAVAEGFLVTGMLLPLICPTTIPWWQVAVATAFAVIIGKEVFGGTGMNILNPALTARAFLFFAYPGQISGDKVWVHLDGHTQATVLGLAASGGPEAVQAQYGFWDMFIGTIPGCIGETSTLMVLIGAGILIATGVGNWKIMFSMLIGGLSMAALFEFSGGNYFGGENFYWHIVAGGFAFGAVFMATDPVSASHTDAGKYIYGFLAGFLGILIRVINPAYPEGIMLAILLMNVLAPLIDYFVINANKKRRLKRATV